MNRLGNETSLYLRQHAENPVDWHPWDDEALAAARDNDRPILLSIGYSACHWCHVMAHESFEDEETAKLMNSLFVNVMVDREERPDLDRIYQLAHQMLSGRGGGWPLTVFLDPAELVPFFAGTYFPVEPRYGMPSFREVLTSVHAWFRENRDNVSGHNKKVLEAIRSVQRPDGGDKPALDKSALERVRTAAQQIYSRHDAVNGGYGGAPKFPQGPTLESVAFLGQFEAGGELHRSLRFTLEQMALSGLRDHLDGGFFRYCVDGDWTIPHFEKMLYDNAQLLALYAEGAERWDSPLLREAAEGIADWLESEMRQPDGGYAASIDADADGEEGGFHVWTPDQVTAVLGEETARRYGGLYGLDGPPNFENSAWHLQLSRPGEGVPPSDRDWHDDARKRLREYRERRIHPALDDKRLCSWNALLALAFTRAGRAQEKEEWLDRAEQVFRFIRKRLWTGDGLLAVYNRDVARFEAYLDDYAWLLEALLAHLQNRWRRDWLEFAQAVADALLARFEDREHGGFYFSDDAVDVPMTRSMLYQDDATPAGNSSAIRALNRLGHLLGEPRYSRAADRCALRGLSAMKDAPGGFASLAAAVRETVLPPPHLLIISTDGREGESLKRWVETNYRVDCYLIGPADATLPGVLGAYQDEAAVTAWLCRGTECKPPVHSRAELEAMLA